MGLAIPTQGYYNMRSLLIQKRLKYFITPRFGLDGKACIMRLICELAESDGLPYNGVLGKALETLFL